MDTDTNEDPRGDAAAALHATLDEVAGMTAHRGQPLDRIAYAQAAATLELVEAVRDLCALVAAATAPTYLVEPFVDDSDAEPVSAPNTVGAWAPHLEPGTRVTVAGGGSFVVTAAGMSEGADWLEVYDEVTAGASRVWLDDLARDERPVEGVTGASPELITKHEPVDADAEGGVDDE